MPLADGEKWSPRALAPSPLPHNALQLAARLEEPFSKTKDTPLGLRTKASPGCTPLQDQAQLGIKRLPITTAKIRGDAL